MYLMNVDVFDIFRKSQTDVTFLPAENLLFEE